MGQPGGQARDNGCRDNGCGDNGCGDNGLWDIALCGGLERLRYLDRRAALGAATLFPAGHSSEEPAQVKARGRAVVWARGAAIDIRWSFCTLLKTAQFEDP